MPENSFFISTDPSKLDIGMICDFLANRSYWAKGRSRSTIQKGIDHSLCFGVYTREAKQVGFARVVTDFAVFAWLMDVFILEEYAGRGLGKLLMKAITGHPELQELKRWGLATKDAQGFYEQFGFTPLTKPENMMERIQQHIK